MAPVRQRAGARAPPGAVPSPQPADGVPSSESEPSSSSETETESQSIEAEAEAVSWQWPLMLASVLATCGSAVMIPFRQGRLDDLGCTKLCLGAVQSSRSALQLIGSPALGRFSDVYGRRAAYTVSCTGNILSLVLFAMTNSIPGVFLMQVPQALLSDLFGVSKAVVGDHTPPNDAGLRSAVLGKLGAATGVGLMLGPALGGKFLADRYQACAVGIVANLLVLVAVSFLPQAPHMIRKDSGSSVADPSKQEGRAPWLRRGLAAAAENGRRIVALGRSASPAVQLLLVLRFSLSLGFHIFNVSFMPSLKARFDMGPKDFGAFMGVVGFFYALSQFVVAKPVIAWSAARGEWASLRVLLFCLGCMGSGRLLSFYTLTVELVGVGLIMVILSLGVLNTFLSTRVSQLTEADKLGTLFGLFESVEKLAGIGGPLVGGLLAQLDDNVPPALVTLMYIAMCLLLRANWCETMEAAMPTKAGNGVAKQPADAGPKSRKND